MKKIFAIAALLLSVFLTGRAQIITHTPAILQESSTNVVLTYHADAPEGNNGLKGVTASDPVYAHIGVITNKSTGNSDWKYAPAWGDNAAKYRLTYVSANTWTLDLGNIREFMGITDANEHVTKIAMVFRNGSCTKEGKTSGGGDIFVDVEPEGYQMRLASNPAATLLSQPTDVEFTVNVTSPSAIALYVNDTKVGEASDATELKAGYSFTAHGAYTVRATATSAQGSLEKTLNYAFPGNSTPGTCPGGIPKMGAVANADGSVTFCIAAPGKSSVVMVPSWDGYQILDKNVMQYQDYQGQRYFFTTVSGLDPDTWYPYYFIVDARYKVADPYARLVLDPYSDKWLNQDIWPDMPKYPYDHFDDVVLAVHKTNFDGGFKFADFKIPDNRNLIVYELLIRDFTGTEGQANAEGTIAAARKKLWYLKNLGVNCIELMPVMEFNGNNSWGYNTNFYMALDKAYGSPDDLRAFVDEAHQLGMAVVLDIVFNQSDGLHPWYQMYGGVNKNPFYNATAPHSYSVLNDWKQENVLVQQQWKDALQFWMTSYNVDGFRFDLVKGLGTSYSGSTDAYNKSRVEVMTRLHQHIKDIKADGIHINENLAGDKEENEMAADGQMNWNNQNGLSCNFAKGSTSNVNLVYFDDEKCSRTRQSLISYAESHDEQRMAYDAKTGGVAAVKNNEQTRVNRLGQVAVQLLMSAGSKMIWQFGELADDQNNKNPNGSNNVDPKKVIWSNLDNENIKHLHNTYTALCNLRNDNAYLFINGTVTYTGYANSLTSARIIRYTLGDQEVMAFINPAVTGANKNAGAQSTKLTPSNARLVCASAGFTPELKQSASGVYVSCPPNSYAVYATDNTAGVDDIFGDGAGNVSVSGGVGEIIINGDYRTVRVYNMQGVQQGGLDVAPGLYIVNVDGTGFKVLVK